MDEPLDHISSSKSVKPEQFCSDLELRQLRSSVLRTSRQPVRDVELNASGAWTEQIVMSSRNLIFLPDSHSVSITWGDLVHGDNHL